MWEPFWCVKVGDNMHFLSLLWENELSSVCVPISPVWWWNKSTLQALHLWILAMLVTCTYLILTLHVDVIRMKSTWSKTCCFLQIFIYYEHHLPWNVFLYSKFIFQMLLHCMFETFIAIIASNHFPNIYAKKIQREKVLKLDFSLQMYKCNGVPCETF